jgi:hypothetical protein
LFMSKVVKCHTWKLKNQAKCDAKCKGCDVKVEKWSEMWCKRQGMLSESWKTKQNVMQNTTDVVWKLKNQAKCEVTKCKECHVKVEKTKQNVMQNARGLVKIWMLIITMTIAESFSKSAINLYGHTKRLSKRFTCIQVLVLN